MDSANFRFESPRGPVCGWFSRRGLRFLELPLAGNQPATLLHSGANDTRGHALAAALDRYFAGLREDFAGIPIDLVGTPFQLAVWEAARGIPWGESTTYGALAAAAGRGQNAARAAGQAIGANPLPLVVPCHRVLAAGGRLGGFGSGLDWKRYLLGLEQVPFRE